MTRESIVSWADIGQKISIPLLVFILGYGTRQLQALNDQVMQLTVDVAVLKEKLATYEKIERALQSHSFAK